MSGKGEYVVGGIAQLLQGQGNKDVLTSEKKKKRKLQNGDESAPKEKRKTPKQNKTAKVTSPDSDVGLLKNLSGESTDISHSPRKKIKIQKTPDPVGQTKIKPKRKSEPKGKEEFLHSEGSPIKGKVKKFKSEASNREGLKAKTKKSRNGDGKMDQTQKRLSVTPPGDGGTNGRLTKCQKRLRRMRNLRLKREAEKAQLGLQGEPSGGQAIVGNTGKGGDQSGDCGTVQTTGSKKSRKKRIQKLSDNDKETLVEKSSTTSSSVVKVSSDSKSRKRKKRAVEDKENSESKVSSGTVHKKKNKSDGYAPPPGVVHESLLEEQKGAPSSLSGTEEADKARSRRKKVENSHRTVFVGNLPVTFSNKDLKKLFRKYGEIDSVRIRSAVASDLSLPKKVAVIKQKYHSTLQRLNGYVVFKEKESAQKALRKNGKAVEGHHLRVDLADATSGGNSKKQHDYARSVFVGNLPFDIDEDSVRKHFKQCGPVENVRIVRDAATGIGKGFGYVLFQESDAVSLALKLNGRQLNSRTLRVTRAVKKEKKPKQNYGAGDSSTKKGGHSKQKSNSRGAKFAGAKSNNVTSALRRLSRKGKGEKK